MKPANLKLTRVVGDTYAEEIALKTRLGKITSITDMSGNTADLTLLSPDGQTTLGPITGTVNDAGLPTQTISFDFSGAIAAGLDEGHWTFKIVILPTITTHTVGTLSMIAPPV